MHDVRSMNKAEISLYLGNLEQFTLPQLVFFIHMVQVIPPVLKYPKVIMILCELVLKYNKVFLFYAAFTSVCL